MANYPMPPGNDEPPWAGPSFDLKRKWGNPGDEALAEMSRLSGVTDGGRKGEYRLRCLPTCGGGSHPNQRYRDHNESRREEPKEQAEGGGKAKAQGEDQSKSQVSKEARRRLTESQEAPHRTTATS